MRKSNSTDVSPCLQYTWHGGWGVGDSEMDEPLPTNSFQLIRNEWTFPPALPGYCESYVVYAALDFVLSFQVCHIASIFPINGCDYVSNT